MSDYSGNDVYKAHTTELFEQMHESIGKAVEANQDKPVDPENNRHPPTLVFVGAMPNNRSVAGDVAKSISNMLTDDENEQPLDAAAYPFLAAVKAAEDIVGKGNVQVSFSINPNYKHQLSKAMEPGLREDLGERMPLASQIAGYLDNENYRVSYDSPLQSPNYADRIDETIAQISMNGSAISHRPEIVVHLGTPEEQGMFQGQSFNDLIEKGSQLTQNGVISPFDEIYDQTLYFNTYQNGASEPLAYATSSENATQIDLKGQLPEDFNVESVMKGMEEASEDYKAAHTDEQPVYEQPTLPPQEGVDLEKYFGYK